MSFIHSVNGALFMRRISAHRIALALLGLLGIAAIMMTLGSKSLATAPSATSYSPSGTAAFAELLRRSGHPVAISNSTNPNLLQGDLAIAFTIEKSDETLPGADQEGAARSTTQQTKAAVGTYVSRGGNALILRLPANFQSATREMRETVVANLPGFPAHAKVKIRDESVATPTSLTSKPAETLDVGTLDGSRTLAVLSKVGKGFALDPADGTLATNRYIDQSANAALLLRLVSILARPGDRIVFTEGTWGNASPPSLMESIGPWALGAWRQLILLGLVIVFTLGKRFGIGKETRIKEQGSRELVDAVAFIHERAKATRPALRTAVTRTEAALRKRLKLDNEASSRDIGALIPDSLARAISDARKLSEYETDPMDALAASRRLDVELNEYLSA